MILQKRYAQESCFLSDGVVTYKEKEPPPLEIIIYYLCKNCILKIKSCYSKIKKNVCMYACMYVCIYVCMHVCMFACMYVCMYAFMCLK